MRRLLFVMTIAGNYVVQLAGDDSPDEICVSFSGGWQLIRRKHLTFREDVLERNKITWIWSRGNDWFIDFDKLKEEYDFLSELDWLRGVSLVQPEFVEYPSSAFGNGTRTSLEFHVYRDEFVIDRKRKLFLSHKGADKPMVRSFFSALRTLGFDPWLDEDAMVAGTELERGLLNGFDQSCAAIFFVTPSFKDVDFLATEVNYAIAEKRKKGERFAIVTIVLEDGGNKGTVPPLLEQYVWKEPENQLEALEEIVRALPIELGEPTWRAHIGPA